MSDTLLDRAIRLLERSALPRSDIAKGALVGVEWLKKFEAGDINDPSVRRIQRLHDFLSGRASAARTSPARQSQSVI